MFTHKCSHTNVHRRGCNVGNITDCKIEQETLNVGAAALVVHKMIFVLDIWISVMIICFSTQITERQGTAMYEEQLLLSFTWKYSWICSLQFEIFI